MAYNGSGTFNITTSGQPVVTGTVISSTAFNALTADLATGLSTAITKDGQTTTTVRVPFAQGISSTLVTDATSATTGSIITAGGISTQKALWVGTTTTLAGALTYGGVALSNAVTGTGNMVLSASPTLTGTLTAAAANFSGTVTGTTSGSNAFVANSTYATAATLGHIQIQRGGALKGYIGTDGSDNLALINFNGSAILSIGANSTFNSGLTLLAALTYGGVTLSNSVTGTGSMVLSASPTLTGNPSFTGVSGVSTVWSLSNTSSAPVLTAYNGKTGGGSAFRWDVGVEVSIDGGLEFYDRTNSVLAGAFASDHSFLLGTTTSGAGIGFAPKCTISGGATTDALVLHTTVAGNEPLDVWNASTSSNNNFVFFWTESTATARGSISYNRSGGLVAYNTTSDYRLKDIQGPFSGSGALLDVIPVYMGCMKGATISRPMFLAHEVAENGMPWAVTGEKDAVKDDGEIIPQQLNESAMVATLWAEVKSLRARIAALESK